MVESTPEQDRIEHNLERTRSRMDARLSELQEHLSPGQVLDDLMGYFRGSEGAVFGRNLMDSVQSNPLPAALTGIGLTWLMASSLHPQQTSGAGKVTSTGNGKPWRTVEEFDRHLRSAEEGVVRQTNEAEAAYRRRLDEAKGKALGVARQAEDTSESFGKRIQDSITAAKQSLTEVAHDLENKATEAAGQLGGIAQSTGNQVAQGAQAVQQMGSNLFATISDNPVLLGVAALAVGALLGALIPQSEEEAALGGMAGQVREAASSLAQKVVDRGGRAAQQVLEAGRDSVQARGLSGDTTIVDLAKKAGSGELIGNVKEVALDVLKAGDDAVRKEGSAQAKGETKPSGSPTAKT
jgi:hypothetical protein